MTTPRTTLPILGLALFSLLACSIGDDANTEAGPTGVPGYDALSALVESEIAFAAAAEAQGTGLAFREYIAEDGIIFRPGPTVAGPWFAEREPGDGPLAWVPVHAAIASSGDLGYTTGPYRAGSESDRSWGHYVSLWKLRDDGSFKVALDIGTPHDEPPGGLPSLSSAQVEADTTLVLSFPAGSADTSSPESLFEADGRLSHILQEEGLLNALDSLGTGSTRFHQSGSFPRTSRNEVASSTAAEQRLLIAREGGEVSRSGTFGYTYGSSEQGEGSGAEAEGNYLAVWKRDPGDPWRLLLFLTDVS